MKKILTCLFIAGSFFNRAAAQTITEKELFTLDYKGNADAYNFVMDSVNNNYCYVYRMDDENKSFIISNSSVSEKFDYAGPEDLKFDSKGNYYAITSNYKSDYGIDNYFLVVNGKVVKNYDYIESYSSYFDKSGNYVFIFKENDLYKLGYYSIENGFRQSEGYENIRAAYKYVEAAEGTEESSEGYSADTYYYNEIGERGFIALANGKAKIIFETTEIPTDYSDINETSITKNKNNELSFIAKKGGKFFEQVGNEFVVSGNKEYNKFELANVPLTFNSNNEPVYIAGDSVSENKYKYWLITGNQKQTPLFGNSKKPLEFSTYLFNIQMSDNGSVSYYGIVDSVIPAKKKYPEEEVYDQYFSKTFFVKDGIAYEMGYNIGPVKYNAEGGMLYSGLADINKNERILMMNYGTSRIVINKKKFDDIYDYGLAPGKEIYYAGQRYADTKKKQEEASYLYLGEKLLGKYDYFSYQYSGNKSSILVFDNKNNYSFVASEKIDSVNFNNIIVTNKGKLPFPETSVPRAKNFSSISNLMYTKNGNMFYVGSIPTNDEFGVSLEPFIDNKSTGKLYYNTGIINYYEPTDRITFLASRENHIYFVTVQF